MECEPLDFSSSHTTRFGGDGCREGSRVPLFRRGPGFHPSGSNVRAASNVAGLRAIPASVCLAAALGKGFGTRRAPPMTSRARTTFRECEEAHPLAVTWL